MKSTITTKLVRIGNSRGIRIPKAVIEQLQLDGDISLDVRPDGLLIRPIAGKPRATWKASLREIAERGDDRLVDGDQLSSTVWDEEEWTW